MFAFIRNHSSFLIGLGAGVTVGVCATMTLQHLAFSLDKKFTRLLSTVEQLQEELHNLNVKISEIERNGTKKGTYSVNQSSGDEDEEEFEEAVDETDFEQLRNWSHLRNRQLQSSVHENVSAGSDERDMLFSQVDGLMEGSDEDRKKALDLLLQRQNQYSLEANFLWRFSKATYQNAAIQQARGLDEKRKELLFKSVDIIQQALARDENIPEVHKWYAITLGSLGDYLGTQEKIKNGFIFKEHIEKAIQLDPEDSSNYYLLGRWCYGVYMLTWVERKLAATLFATPPSATVEEALNHFLKADALTSKPWKENSLFIAKCYVEKRDYCSAVTWLQKAGAVPSNSQDDKAAHSEVEKLLAQYGRYSQ